MSFSLGFSCVESVLSAFRCSLPVNLARLLSRRRFPRRTRSLNRKAIPTITNSATTTPMMIPTLPPPLSAALPLGGIDGGASSCGEEDVMSEAGMDSSDATDAPRAALMSTKSEPVVSPPSRVIVTSAFTEESSLLSAKALSVVPSETASWLLSTEGGSKRSAPSTTRTRE